MEEFFDWMDNLPWIIFMLGIFTMNLYFYDKCLKGQKKIEKEMRELQKNQSIVKDVVVHEKKTRENNWKSVHEAFARPRRAIDEDS